MNKVSKITDKEAYRDQWIHRTNPCLLLGGRCFSTGSDILYIKKMLVNSVGNSRDEKILQLYTTLVVPWQKSMFLRHLNHQKSIALVTKTCVWESVAFLCQDNFWPLLYDIDQYMLK